jgi:hypothetical protein
LAIIKAFPIRERTRIEVRAEFYNAFNHTNFSSFDTNAVFNTNGTPATNPNWGQETNSGLGEFTGAGNPRQMQAIAKISF